MNRILNIECCEFSNLSKSGFETKLKSNCNLSQNNSNNRHFNCGNRALQLKEYPKTEKIQEFGRGFGLKTLENITNGQLVIEYIGEVIDENEMRTRMINQRINSPDDHDFYIMQLDTGFYVDGKFKGSNSRFINHSCDPNCELIRWVVNGTMRIAITALRDIDENESLSYDYQFDTKEDQIFKCYCGSANCRGTMSPAKKSTEINDFLNKMQQLLLIPLSSLLANDITTTTASVSSATSIDNSNSILTANESVFTTSTSKNPLYDDSNKVILNINDNHVTFMLDFAAMNELSANDRKKLIQLGRLAMIKRGDNINDINSLKNGLKYSYVSKYLPGDSIMEVSHPLFVSFHSQTVF